MRGNSFQGVAAALLLAALGASAGQPARAQYFDIRGVGGSGGDSARACVQALGSIPAGRARGQGLPTSPDALLGMCRGDYRFRRLGTRQWACVAQRVRAGENHQIAIGRCY